MNYKKLEEVEELLTKRKWILNSIDLIADSSYEVYVKSGGPSGLKGTVYVPKNFRIILINELKKEQGEIEKKLEKFIL